MSRVIDDVVLEPMTRDESRDVYQLFVERTARAATIITSNRDTADWLALFDDALLGQSAVDLLPSSPVARLLNSVGGTASPIATQGPDHFDELT